MTPSHTIQVSCSFLYIFFLVINCILDHHFRETMKDMDEIAKVTIFLGVVCTVIMGISRRDGDFLMSMLTMIICLALKINGPMSLRGKEALKDIPRGIRSALLKFNLENRTIIYAVCPSCHYTYEPHFPKGSATPVYVARCTNRPNPEAPICNEPLLRSIEDEDGSRSAKPIKPFVYHHFHDYLAGLLSRPDLEDVMDKSCDDLFKSRNDPPPEYVNDFWQAKFIRSFEGPQPGKLFIDRRAEGRFAFTLNVDSFNVEGMRIRGATKSCSLISMVCLNLPPEIRYKPENIYIAGIIPGPKQPSLTDLNHYIRPLIDHLVESWEKGVRYSKTARHPEGRLTRTAIAAVVCDLPAARHLSQLASATSHHHCSCCNSKGKENLGNTNCDRWTFRNVAQLREQAQKWKHASTLKEQEAIFKAYGTRWSELWRLTYWDPTTQLVVDCMHTLLEGSAQDHFRHILDLTTTSANTQPPPVPAFTYQFQKIDLGDGPLPDGITEKEAKQVDAIHTLLLAPLDGVHDDHDQQAINDSLEILRRRLNSKNITPLSFVCRDLQIPLANDPDAPRGTRVYKKDWLNALIKWVSVISQILASCSKTFVSSVNKNLLHRPMAAQSKSQRPKSCSAYRTLSRTPLYPRGSIPFLITLEMLLPVFSKLMNGELYRLFICPLR